MRCSLCELQQNLGSMRWCKLDASYMQKGATNFVTTREAAVTASLDLKNR